MSHIRLSETSTGWSPQIPRVQADLVVSLEPLEAIRVLASYGNSKVIVLSNTKPIYAVGVISGDGQFP